MQLPPVMKSHDMIDWSTGLHLYTKKAPSLDTET